MVPGVDLELLENCAEGESFEHVPGSKRQRSGSIEYGEKSFQRQIRFWSGEMVGMGAMRIPRFPVPDGIEHRLAYQGHAAHARAGVAPTSAPAARLETSADGYLILDQCSAIRATDEPGEDRRAGEDALCGRDESVGETGLPVPGSDAGIDDEPLRRVELRVHLSVPASTSPRSFRRLFHIDAQVHVDEPGRDDMTGSIPGTRICGDLHIGADCRDDTIFDEDGGRFDDLSWFGDHICAGDGVDFRCPALDPLTGFGLRVQTL